MQKPNTENKMVDLESRLSALEKDAKAEQTKLNAENEAARYRNRKAQEVEWREDARKVLVDGGHLSQDQFNKLSLVEAQKQADAVPAAPPRPYVPPKDEPTGKVLGNLNMWTGEWTSV